MLAGAAVVAVAAAAAMVAALLSFPDALRDVAVLEIGGGDGDGRVELVPVDAGAAGPESLAFDPAGGGPYAGVSDGRVLRWVPGERRWEEHSASCAPELYVRLASSLVFLACMTRACAIRFFFLAIMLPLWSWSIACAPQALVRCAVSGPAGWVRVRRRRSTYPLTPITASASASHASCMRRHVWCGRVDVVWCSS